MCTITHLYAHLITCSLLSDCACIKYAIVQLCASQTNNMKPPSHAHCHQQHISPLPPVPASINIRQYQPHLIRFNIVTSYYFSELRTQCGRDSSREFLRSSLPRIRQSTAGTHARTRRSCSQCGIPLCGIENTCWKRHVFTLSRFTRAECSQTV